MSSVESARPVLIHHHIFKNAGTSLIWALQQRLGTDRVLEWDGPSGNDVITVDAMRDYASNHPEAIAVSSHGACLGLVNDENITFHSLVLLRDPIARIPSMYHFERQQNAQTPGAINAKKYELEDYVRWRLDERPLTVSNFQTLYCARNGSVAASPDEDSLARAKDRLTACSAVGLVEKYDLFLRQTSKALDQLGIHGAPLRSTQANVSTQGTKAVGCSGRKDPCEPLSQDLVSLLIERNQLDFALLAHAKSLMQAASDT